MALFSLGATLGCDDPPIPGATPLVVVPLTNPASVPVALAAPVAIAVDAGAAAPVAPVAKKIEAEIATPVVNEKVVVRYLAYLKAYVPAAKRAAQALERNSAAPAARPHAAIPRRTFDSGRPPPDVPELPPQIAESQARRAALSVVSEQVRKSAGLEVNQLQEVSTLVSQVAATREHVDGSTLSHLERMTHDRRMSSEARTQLKKTLASTKAKADALRKLTPQRQRWGDAAVDAVVKHFAALKALNEQRTQLERPT